MDTRPRHGLMTERREFVYATKKELIDSACPRPRFFAEARKRDDGDARAHRRGGLTPHSAEKIGAAAGVVHE
jgi:hypothetical protein